MPKLSKTKMIRPSKSLELPYGYQSFDYYKTGKNPNGVWLDTVPDWSELESDAEVYMYTQHEVFLEDGLIKHTRSSPNWEGGMVTYATCKHNMRTYTRKTWLGVWIVGLCPAHCAENTVMFIGRVSSEFNSNYELRQHVHQTSGYTLNVKTADNNPRGDLYTPRRKLLIHERHDHAYYYEPPDHTRSLEHYAKSPGSKSNRPDGKIPKWWRDLEYLQRGTRPRLFALSPCYLFSQPQLWTSYQPRRACLRLTLAQVAASLTPQPASLAQQAAPTAARQPGGGKGTPAPKQRSTGQRKRYSEAQGRAAKPTSKPASKAGRGKGNA